MIFCKDGTTVQIAGNTIIVSNGECYMLNGTFLSGPGGFSNYNVSSIGEAAGIVAGLHGGRKM